MEYDLIDKDNYDNYIDEVVNISKTSTEKMSITSLMKMFIMI